jgi:cytochrome c peroxidase
MKIIPSIGAARFKRLSAGLLGSILLICIAILLSSIWLRVPQRIQAAERPVSSPLSPLESDEPIQPIEALTGLDPRKIELGRELFDDTRLSHNNQLSCATCHVLKKGGADGRRRSIGIYGAVGVINAPSVLNSGFNFSQFWDGRAETLEQQAGEPIQSKTEMGSTWPEVVDKLQGSSDYVRAFRRIYNDGIKSDHIKDSIAEFERSLSTPDSRFDRYLRHDSGALTAREQQGYKLFKSFGCASCHQGANVGGNMYQKLGVMASYFTDRGDITRADFGRFNVTGNPLDRYMFKVPSLRNVELTAPYFHDGSAATLADAVGMMARYQIGQPLTGAEVELIVEFLKTLTGRLNGQSL